MGGGREGADSASWPERVFEIPAWTGLTDITKYRLFQNSDFRIQDSTIKPLSSSYCKKMLDFM